MLAAAAAILLVSSVTPMRGQPASTPPPSTGQTASPAPELTPDQVRPKITAYLGAIDTRIPESVWKGFGPAAIPVLKEILADPKQPAFRRARALGVLSVVAPGEAATVAPNHLSDESEAYLVRLTAVKALQRSLPDSEFHSSMTGFLSSAKDVRIRAQIATALAERTGVCTEVHQQISREREQDRGFFHAALKHCPQ
jgi:hypothetical protein